MTGHTLRLGLLLSLILGACGGGDCPSGGSCSAGELDPDSARANPEVLKALVRANDNRGGVYASVLRRGRVAVGQPVFFEAAVEGGRRP